MASRTARTCPDCDTCDGAGLVDLTPNPAAVQAHELELRVLARRHRD